MSADLSCLGGGVLKGWNPVRYIYLDESGTGNILREPYVVVAGVLLYPDEHWRQASNTLRRHVEDAVGARAAPKFVCHANELWKPPKASPLSREEGRALLKKVAAIPRDMKLTVVWGHWDRRDAQKRYSTAKKALEASHALAFANCLVAAEKYLRRNAKDGEIAQVVAEDHQHHRRILKTAFGRLGPNSDRPKAIQTLLDSVPLNHLVDTVHFAQKHEASLLQIADACAYAIRGRLSGIEDCQDLWDMIRMEMSPVPRKLPPLVAKAQRP